MRHSGAVPTAHAVHGFLGAGKSTFARSLGSSLNAPVLDWDGLYLSLFTDGQPTSALDPVLGSRLTATLRGVWQDLVRCGSDVVLDFGFWSRASRDLLRDDAATVGAEVRLYSVQCDPVVGLRRCLVRNADAAPGSFLIDEAAFVDLGAAFEELGPDEPATVVNT